MNRTKTTLLAAFALVALVASASHAAFSSGNLNKQSAGYDDGPAIWVYEEPATALATIVASNYFASGTEAQRLEVGDFLMVYGSDGSGLYAVTAASTTTSTLVALNDATSTFAACVESTVTFDPAPTTFGSVEEKDVTATGAALGDTCQVSAPYDLTNQVSAECYVDATDSAVINLRQPGIILRGSATHNPTNVDDGNVDTDEITVTGAALGDPASCTFSLDLADLALTCSVTAAGTVTATFLNNTGAAVDLDSGTLTAAVEDISASAVNLASGTWNVRTCTPIP
jgi:hypothetical protein